VAALVFATPVRTAAQIRVEQIVPSLRNDTLAVSARFTNLFSKKIIGTIQSGLPSIIQIELRLLDSRKNQLARRHISKSIAYDIWDEKYKIRHDGGEVTLARFEQVRAVSAILEKEGLISRRKLATAGPYVCQVRVGIIPISARQAERVTDWLLDPNETEERVASENRTSGFELNISKLLSFFVSKKKGSKYISPWFSSKPFRLHDLTP